MPRKSATNTDDQRVICGRCAGQATVPRESLSEEEEASAQVADGLSGMTNASESSRVTCPTCHGNGRLSLAAAARYAARVQAAQSGDGDSSGTQDA